MKAFTSILGLSLTSLLLADQSSIPQESFPITQLCCPEIFKPNAVSYYLYGECLYLQPNSSNRYYGAEAIALNPNLSNPAAKLASPDWKILNIDPDYQFGFEIGAGVLLNSANMDIELNWERLRGQDSDSLSVPSTNESMLGPFFDIGPNSKSYKRAHGEIASYFDGANLSFGKKFCFFNNFLTHFYGGVGFTRIKQTFQNRYSSRTEPIFRQITTTSTFTGAGPQIGLDYDYRIHKNFFFSGKSVLSLLMGQMKNSANYQSTTTEFPEGLPQPNKQSTLIPNKTQLIPGFDQKLGFSYLATYKRLKATFEIGYRCQIYLNAVQTIDMASQALPADADVYSLVSDVGLFALAFEQNNSDFMLTGPYVSAGIEF